MIYFHVYCHLDLRAGSIVVVSAIKEHLGHLHLVPLRWEMVNGVGIAESVMAICMHLSLMLPDIIQALG
jgi:hypothetical protein